jgi:hypothetical protein
MKGETGSGTPAALFLPPSSYSLGAFLGSHLALFVDGGV